MENKEAWSLIEEATEGSSFRKREDALRKIDLLAKQGKVPFQCMLLRDVLKKAGVRLTTTQERRIWIETTAKTYGFKIENLWF